MHRPVLKAVDTAQRLGATSNAAEEEEVVVLASTADSPPKVQQLAGQRRVQRMLNPYKEYLR